MDSDKGGCFMEGGRGRPLKRGIGAETYRQGVGEQWGYEVEEHSGQKGASPEVL